ncbi:hypothetical protein ACJ41O_005661 [Fusarium nematophilum]
MQGEACQMRRNTANLHQLLSFRAPVRIHDLSTFKIQLEIDPSPRAQPVKPNLSDVIGSRPYAAILQLRILIGAREHRTGACTSRTRGGRETGLGDFMQSSISSSNLQPKVVIEAALKAPYLMNELLALAALHLSQSSLHRHDLQQEAATLQTRALSSFNKAKQQVSEDNCIPLFLFSSFLGLHMLCDTIQNRQDSFSSFLDQFMVYLDIHRGVSAVTSQSWPLIKRSEFGPSIQRIESALHCDESSDGDETQILHRMISDTYLSPASAKAYRATLTVLQSCLNLYHRLEEEGLRPSEAPIAFCITVNDEYVGFLKQRQPEALVILAYYAVMLYRCRDFWIFGDGGEYLIRSISAHLGAHGADWLAWPNSFLE